MSPATDCDIERDRDAATPPPVAGSTVDVLARTLWGEARGEPVAGKEAVAAVILNRVARARAAGGRYWWGSTVEEVCRRPWQFSCWNPDDPNRPRIEAVTMEDRAFRTCVRIARRALGGVVADATEGATHYHAVGLLPPWARGLTPSAEIGGHLFYRNVE